MKIKRFNESFMENTFKYSYIDLKADIPFNKSDMSKIHRMGRKVYVITNRYEVKEITNHRNIRMFDNINNHFTYAVVIKEENLPIVEKYSSLIKEIDELYNKKLNLLFKHMLSNLQEKQEKEDKEENK